MKTQDERLGRPSASSMPRIYACPGSRQAEAECAEELPSDEAQEGSEIATALEQMNTETLSDDAKPIAERLLEMEQRAVRKWCDDIGFTGTPVMHREERLWIRDMKGEPVASAKPDAFYLAGESALVINHKTGYLPVSHAAVNAQVRCEAVALWKEFPSVNRVRVALARYRFKEEFTASDYGAAELGFADYEIMFHTWRSMQPGAVLQAGEHCRYCRARGTCKAAAAWSLLPSVEAGALVAQQDGAAINLERCVAAVAQLTPQQMAFMHGNAGVINKILEAIKERLKAMPDDVLQSVGLRRGAPVKQRMLPEINALWEHIWNNTNTVLGEHHIDANEFRTVCKASVSLLEQLITEKIVLRDGGTKKAATEKAKKLMEAFVTYQEQEARLLKI